MNSRFGNNIYLKIDFFKPRGYLLTSSIVCARLHLLKISILVIHLSGLPRVTYYIL